MLPGQQLPGDGHSERGQGVCILRQIPCKGESMGFNAQVALELGCLQPTFICPLSNVNATMIVATGVSELLWRRELTEEHCTVIPDCVSIADGDSTTMPAVSAVISGACAEIHWNHGMKC